MDSAADISRVGTARVLNAAAITALAAAAMALPCACVIHCTLQHITERAVSSEIFARGERPTRDCEAREIQLSAYCGRVVLSL